MPLLKSIQGEHVGKEFPLGEKPILVGRRETNFIVLAHNKASRSHAEFFLREGRGYVRDLNSSNGVYVNGIRLPPNKPRPLRAGDEIRIAGTIFRYFESDLALPTVQIPGHELLEVIAEGGMGIIYRGRQVSMDREVAIKILHPRYAQRRDFINRFIQEARSAGKLNHPNIIQVHNVGKSGEDCYYFTMELVRGATLTQRMGNRETLSLATILEVGAKVADALEYAHQRGIIHRDVKPDNIIIADSGEIKLADLGIAKSAESGAEEGRRVLGTPHYMSPEQAAGKPLDGRSDLYSLGATLYHAIAGTPLFDAEKSEEVMAMHLDATPKPLREAAPDTPPEVAAIIDRLLAKNPNDRYATAAEVRDAFEAAKEALKQAAAESVKPAAPPRPPTTAERRRAVASSSSAVQIAVMACVAAAFILLGLIFLGNGESGGKNNSSTGSGKSSIARPDSGPKRLAEAEALERSGDLNGAIEKYTRIALDFGEESAVGSEALRRKNEINKRLASANEAKRREEEWRRYLEFRHSHADDENALLKQLVDLERRFPDLRETIQKERQRLTEERQQRQAALFKKFEDEVDRLLKAQDIDGALAAIDRFQAENVDHPRQGELDGLRQKAEAAGKAKLEEFTRKMQELRPAKNYSQIFSRIAVCRKEVKYAPLLDEAARVEKEVMATLEEAYAALEKSVRETVRNREFEKARTEMEGQRLAFLNTPLEEKIGSLDALIANMERLHDKVIESINSSEPWLVPKEFGIKRLEGKTINGAGRDGIHITAGGVARTVLKWSDFSARDIAKIYERYLAPQDAESQKHLVAYKEMFAAQ
ncbi:MAG: protein kinase [Planctomycetota bacterium]|nr:protein kinase [Planctomycetota bacterium]